MSDAPIRSALVALLFALHPVNVDSVAWAAERKNILSTFFWLLTMLFYYYYCRKPDILRYLSVLFVFTLGLLAKPMLVTLPFVLLLFDYWPLKRITFESHEPASTGKRDIIGVLKEKKTTIIKLISEKIPLVILSLISIFISAISITNIGADKYKHFLSMSFRIKNALVSYIKYIYILIIPHNLTFFYTYPDSVPVLYVIGSLLVIGIITIAAVRRFRKSSYFLIGWLWFLGTLLPVSGLIQGGLWPAIAERWAYVPFIGLYIIVVWGFFEITSHLKHAKIIIPSAFSLVFFIFMILTSVQASYWKNNFTLYEHAIVVDPNNYVAFDNLGIAYYRKGEREKSIDYFNKSLQINQNNPYAHNDFAFTLQKKNPKEAISHYYRAIELSPNFIQPYINLGILFSDLGRLDDAIKILTQALKIDPDTKAIYYNMGTALAKKGENQEAIKYLREGVERDPKNAKAHNNLGAVYMKLGKTDEAIKEFSTAIKIDPGFAESHNNLGILFGQQGKMKESMYYFSEAVRYDPKNAQAHNNLGVIYAKQGNIIAAWDHFNKAIKIDPNDANLHYALALCLKEFGNLSGAIDHLQEALRLKKDDIKAQQMLVIVLAKKKEIEEEIKKLRMVQQSRPQDPLILQKLAVMYRSIGDLNSSMSYLQKLLEIQPNNPDVYYNIACIYSLQNNINDSMSYLEKSVSKGFKNWTLAQNDVDLENVRQTPGFKKIMKNQ
jgi:tetratricopeptide (TPR) repeat protein